MKHIFEPVKMNHIKLKNRLVRSATWEGIASPDGSVTEETYEIYEELAKGGVGAIITGFTSVVLHDYYFGGMMRLCNDALIPQYKRLTDIILAGHSLGANKVIYYLSHNHDKRVEHFFLLSPANLTHMMSGVTEREKRIIKDQVERGDGDFTQAEKITHSGALLVGTYDNFTDGDPSEFLRNLNNHMPMHKENKLIFIEKTGHTYQMKNQEVADDILHQLQEWRAHDVQWTSALRRPEWNGDA